MQSPLRYTLILPVLAISLAISPAAFAGEECRQAMKQVKELCAKAALESGGWCGNSALQACQNAGCTAVATCVEEAADLGDFEDAKKACGSQQQGISNECSSSDGMGGGGMGGGGI